MKVGSTGCQDVILEKVKMGKWGNKRGDGGEKRQRLGEAGNRREVKRGLTGWKKKKRKTGGEAIGQKGQMARRKESAGGCWGDCVWGNVVEQRSQKSLHNEKKEKATQTGKTRPIKEWVYRFNQKKRG